MNNEIVSASDANEIMSSLKLADFLLPATAFSFGAYNMYFRKVYYISDIHLLHHLQEINGYELKVQMSNIVKNLFSQELIEDIENTYSYPSFLIFFGGDTSSNKEIVKNFYHEFRLTYEYYLLRKKSDQEKEKFIERLNARDNKLPIFVILGNHELSDFGSVDEAAIEYHAFFEKEKIHFLHNEIYKREDFAIVGGIGFAKYNECYNSTTICTTTPPISREQEVLEAEKFASVYNEALAYSKEKGKLLIVLSHYPVGDWLEGKKTSAICTYFTGHDHRPAETEHTETISIYADNQIGYYKKDIAFKSCILGLKYNPFIEYTDGYFEIKPSEYLAFMQYSNERIQGTGGIDQQLKTGNAKFYMIKQGGFYGFFVINEKTGTKICTGGSIKTISKIIDIKYFELCFTRVLEHYALTLAPYRKIQEKISQEVKRLGFEGKIHGCIIDVDFYHHIMLNLQDGTVTFYYSPYLGCVRPYPSFEVMLQDIGQKQLETCSNTIITYNQMKSEKCLITRNVENASEYIDKMINVDIKSGIYPISRKVNQIQRIFSSNILREWDDNLAQLVLGDSCDYYTSKKIMQIKSDEDMDNELEKRFFEIVRIENEEEQYVMWEVKKQITQGMLYAIIRKFLEINNRMFAKYDLISFSYSVENKYDYEYVDVLCKPVEIVGIYKQLLVGKSQYVPPIRLEIDCSEKEVDIRIHLYGSKPNEMLVYNGNYKYDGKLFDRIIN